MGGGGGVVHISASKSTLKKSFFVCGLIYRTQLFLCLEIIMITSELESKNINSRNI